MSNIVTAICCLEFQHNSVEPPSASASPTPPPLTSPPPHTGFSAVIGGVILVLIGPFPQVLLQLPAEGQNSTEEAKNDTVI